MEVLGFALSPVEDTIAVALQNATIQVNVQYVVLVVVLNAGV